MGSAANFNESFLARGQLFDVQLELSASDAWVVDTTCVDGCTNTMQVYDPSFSSTANIQSTSGGLTFGSYTASGNIMQDTMQLGSYMVQSQVFRKWISAHINLIAGSLNLLAIVSAKHISAKWITGPVSGSLGLGFGGDLAPRGPSFLQSLVFNNQLESTEMSFWLRRYTQTAGAQSDEPDGGAFTLGGFNASLFSGDIDFQNVSMPTTVQQWKLSLKGVAPSNALLLFFSYSQV
jgi:cathepsin D